MQAKNTSIRIDVPGDGSCLFWSVALAYLIPLRDDDVLFQQRYEALFGNEEAVTQSLDHIKNLVRSFNVDDKFASLVRSTFRTRVIDHMYRNKDDFKDFISEEFDLYLTKMKNPYTWGDEPEVKAMSKMLDASVSVFDEADKLKVKHGNGDIEIQLLHVSPQCLHYNFYLEQNVISNDQMRQMQNNLQRLKGRAQDSTSLQVKTSKPKLYNFIENLFKTSMNKDVLVDMIIMQNQKIEMGLKLT